MGKDLFPSLSPKAAGTLNTRPSIFNLKAKSHLMLDHWQWRDVIGLGLPTASSVSGTPPRVELDLVATSPELGDVVIIDSTPRRRSFSAALHAATSETEPDLSLTPRPRSEDEPNTTPRPPQSVTTPIPHPLSPSKHTRNMSTKSIAAAHSRLSVGLAEDWYRAEALAALLEADQWDWPTPPPRRAPTLAEVDTIKPARPESILEPHFAGLPTAEPHAPKENARAYLLRMARREEAAPPPHVSSRNRPVSVTNSMSTESTIIATPPHSMLFDPRWVYDDYAEGEKDVALVV